MSTEVTLGTQPLINSVNKAVTALETLDKAVGNLGKGKSSIDILKASFKEFESVGNASVKAMAAAGNQAVTELERLNKRQTSLKGLLGRVEGTKGALKPETLIAVRKEFESNAASIAQTVKSLQTTLAGLYSEFDRRNVSTQALRGLKQELADVEAAAKTVVRQVKPLQEISEGKSLSAAQLYRANAGVQAYRSGRAMSAEHLYRANAGIQKLLSDMAAEETKDSAQRGREKLAQIRQDNSQAIQAHKTAKAAERSTLSQENALTLAMIAAEGKAFQERGREKLAQIRQDNSEVVKAHREAAAAERKALMDAHRLYNAGDKELASIRNRLAAGKKIKLDLDLSAFDKPTPKLDLPDPKKVDGVTGSFDRMSRALWDSHSAVRGLASGFGLLWLTWGNTLPLLAGAIASFSVVKSFKVGTELERSMFEIVNLAGLGATEAGKLKETLLDLGKTSTYTATQAAEAAKILSLAGLKGAEVQAALVPTLRFASSGGVTMERAAEVLTSVGEAYAFSANAYSTVSDVIVKASSDSIASVEDMAEAFKTSSVLAQSYGVSLTDTAFALESLANIGIKGSAAGTSYRNFVTELTKADGKAGAMMKAIGVTALDSTGRMRPLLDITRDLTAATINMSGAEQRRVQDALANERGGKLYAATQAVLSKELKTSQQATLDEAAAMQASGKVKDAQALRVKAVANAYEILAKRQKESVESAAGLTFFADLEKKVNTGGMFQGIQASLSSQLSAAFDAAQPALNSFALALRETINSEQFKNDLIAITTTLVDLGKAALDGAKWLYEHKEAVLLAGAAYVGLPAVIAAITAGIGFWTGGMATLTASITAAKVAAVSNFQQIAGVLTGATSSIAAAQTFAALSATAMTAGVVALGVAVAVAAATVAAAGVAYLLYGDSVEAATRKALEAEAKLSKDKAASIAAQIKTTNDGLNAEIEGTKAAIKEKEKGTAAGEVATRVMGAQAIARVNAYWDEINVLARKNLELEKGNILLKGGDWYEMADAEDRYNRASYQNLKDRNEALKDLEGRIETLVKLKRQEAKLDMDASERNRKHEQGKDKGPATANRFGPRQVKPYQDLKDFTSTVAALGKAELDALKNSRIAKLAELKDYHDAGIISIGNYQAQVISVTEAGYKDEAAKLKENLDRELTELDAYRAKVVKNDKLQADDKFDRLQSLSTKKLAIEAQYQTDVAKLRQDADDAERNAAIKQAKDLMEIRKKTEEAIAASMDRREALREESEVANRTAGLAGPELDAVHARLKVELQGRKDLRRIDIAAAVERTSAAQLLASYEQELDSDVALKKWEAYLAANDKVSALLAGRSELEIALGEEAAEAYAFAYKKSFKKIADEIAESLSAGITDALFTGGSEGWKKLRDTLKKELLMKPFQMVVKAIIQPVAQGMANMVTNTLYGGGGSGGMPSIPGLDNLFGGSGGGMYGSFATSSIGQSLGLAEASWYGAEVGLTSLGQSIGAAMPYIGLATAALSLLAGMDDSGTYHTGGVGGYSAAGGARTGAAAGVRFGVDAKDYTASAESAATAMAKSVVGLLDSTATTFGKEAGYYAATAFADDTSADGAWGALMVKMGDKVLLDWGDNPSAQGDERVPRVFADGEAGAKEYAAAVATDVKMLIDGMQLPDWAKNVVNSVAGATPTLESLQAALDQVAAVPGQILQNLGTSTEALAGVLMAGMQKADPQGAGQHFADLITYGIEASLYQGFASQVTGIISTQLITPVVTAMAAGATITEAMASVSIDTMKSQVAAAGATFSAMMNDPTFKTALSELNTLIGTTVGGAIANLPPAPTAPAEYAAAAAVAEQASSDLAQAAEDLAKRFTDAESALLDTQGSLNIGLLRAQGKEEAALAAERAEALSAYSEFSAAEQDRLASLYDQNQVIRDQIKALETAKEAFDTFTSKVEGAAEKFLSGDALKGFELSGLATKLNTALSTSFNAADLSNLGLEDVKAAVIAFVSSDAAPKAKTAVIEVGEALLEMSKAAKALEESFLSVADSVADKILSGDALKNFKLTRLATQINEAIGTSFDALDLDSISIDSLKQMVLAYSQNAEIAPEARIAVMQLGASLLDMKQAAAETAKALEESFLSVADSVADKFLSGDALKSFKLGRLATQINEAIGTSFDALDLDSISIDSLKQMVLAYSQNAEIAPEARIAVMQLGASLLDLKQSALDAADAAAKVITDQRLNLERQLLTVNGDTVALRALDLAAIDSSNRALQDHIWAMEDAKVAAEKAAAAERARADQQLGLQLQIANLSGHTAAIRAHELSLLDGELNQALQQHIWLLEDQKAATEAAAAAAEKNAETLRTNTDNAYSALERAVAAQRKTVETQRQAAQDLVQEVTAVFDTLKSNVADLFGEVEDARRFQAAQGRAFIAAAITGAKAGTGLPDSKELAEAISAARAGLSDTVFTSQAESDFQRLVLANELKNLQSLSGDQLTEAERQLKLSEDQLKSLDATLETAKSQLDALRGIDTSVISVRAAIDRLGLAMAAERAGAPAAVQAASAAPATTAAATNQPLTMAEQVAAITASPTMTLAEQVAAMSAAGESNKQALQDYLSTYRTQIVGYSDAAKASIEVFMSALKGSMAQSQGVTDAAFVRSQVEFFGSALANVPAFDVGTNYVPRDMIAQIHEGEAIVPKAYNPAANGGGNERLENLVEVLTSELRVLQAIVNTGNTHARRTADTLDNVTEGGSNMRTIAA